MLGLVVQNPYTCCRAETLSWLSPCPHPLPSLPPSLLAAFPPPTQALTWLQDRYTKGAHMDTSPSRSLSFMVRAASCRTRLVSCRGSMTCGEWVGVRCQGQQAGQLVVIRNHN